MIEVKDLTKKFGSKLAVDKVSFSVERGQVLGFLGPNGAGKSTTMRMVTGYYPPTSGTISVGGKDILDDPIAAKTQIGYLPENAPLYTDMTVKSFLQFTAALRGLRGREKKKMVDRAIDMCFLDNVKNQSVDTLSKGYRHRTCFAQSVIGDPDVLILDEPTDGLDPNQKHEVRNLIRRMGEEKAIIFSTHILEEVEASCTNVLVIDAGKVVANGTPDELRDRADESGQVVIRFGKKGSEDPKALFSGLKSCGDIVISDDDGSVTATLTPTASAKKGELCREVYQLAQSKGLDMEELHTKQGRMDDFFRKITGATRS